MPMSQAPHPSTFPILLVLAMVTPLFLGAQTPGVDIRILPEDRIQELTLRDGSTLFGRVIDAGDPVHFRTGAGQLLEIPHADIVRLREARGRVVDGRFQREDPNATRLFFGPTARTLRTGEGYLSVFEVLFPLAAVGITDRLTFGGGFPLFWAGEGIPFWIAPKVGIRLRDNLQLAGGVLAFFLPRADESAGLLYGVTTVGEPDAALHFGVGYGFVNRELASRPAILLGGEYRVGSHVKLLTENYLFPEEGGVLGGGIRLFGERLSADLGIATPIGTNDDLFIFPLVNFSWSW